MGRRIVAAVSDMLFLAKIRETARHLGVEVDAVRTVEALLASVADRPDLVLVDLADAKLDAVAAIERLKRDPELTKVPVLGFFPHVMTGLRRRALDAGCDRVLPRSKFAATLPDVLAGGGPAGSRDAQRLD